MPNFYTYLWLREDGTPYYAGKGHGKRAFRPGCPSHERIILQDHPSEQEALEAEKFLISYFGRKDVGTGILRNFTDGGEGKAGMLVSPITCQKLSEGKQGARHPLFGKHHSSQARAAMREAALARWSRREKLQSITRTFVFTADMRKKIRAKALERERVKRLRNGQLVKLIAGVSNAL